MKVRIIKIGNSQGIRIPKPFLVQSGIENEVELKMEKNQLIILPVKQARKGWKEAFSKQITDDQQLDEYQNISNQWDHEEWQW